MNETISGDVSAAQLLELHHQRLDDVLDDVELMADSESWKEAAHRFDAFRREMEAHIRLEEEIMFPAFENDPSMPQGPTTVMRAEHVTIRAYLAGIGGALAEQRPISRTVAELEAHLGAHNFKEERVLYPTFERMAPAAIRATLAGKVRALLVRRG